MNKINTILIDDEQEALDSLEILLGAFNQINIVKKCKNPIDVFPAILKTDPDLLFLDIKMPTINGIELLEKIRECSPTLVVIIVTAFENYTMEAIKHNAFSYLLKPVNRVELKSTIEKVQRYFESKNPVLVEKVLINSKNKTILVDPNELVFFEAEGNYTRLYMDDTSEILVCTNMGAFASRFSKSEFVRVNRSLIVNKNKILSLNRKEKTCLIKYNQAEKCLNVSLSFLKEFNSIFTND